MTETKIISIETRPFKSNTGWYVEIKFLISPEWVSIFIAETKDNGLCLLGYNYDEEYFISSQVQSCSVKSRSPQPPNNYDGEYFIYSQAITSSSASEGILQYLRELKEGNVKGNFTLESNIFRAIKALNFFWD